MRQFWTSFDVEFHGLTIWWNHISNLPTIPSAGNFTPLLTKNLLKIIMIKIEAKFYGWAPFLMPAPYQHWSVFPETPSHKILTQLRFHHNHLNTFQYNLWKLSRDYTVPYLVPGVTFCEKQVHCEKVVTQELSDQSLLKYIKIYILVIREKKCFA